MSLTVVTIRNAKPQDKPYKLSDSGGLFLLVQPNGGKWWRYKYRFAGKEKLLSLGIYPDVSLAEARDYHIQARKVLAAGKDPSSIKQEAKRLAIQNRENSFEAIAREWIDNRKDSWTPKYTKNILSMLEANVFTKIGSSPIAEITAQELLTVFRAIEDRGVTDLAHRSQQVCGQIFAFALASGRAERNPAIELRGALKPHVVRHYSHLKQKELPDFIEKLEEYSGNLQTKLAIKLLMLTFVRTSELRTSKWEDIDFKAAEWRIPAEKMKMRTMHIVPLSKQAIKVLQEVQKLTGNREYIFPNQHKPKGYMSENTIIYGIYRMGYHTQTTGHGFRATASTILNENGFVPDVIERQLAHLDKNKVRASYNHAQYLPERKKMMQWWANLLDKQRKTSMRDAI